VGRPDAPAITAEQAISREFSNGPLDCIVPGEILARVHPHGQLHDRELRGMKDKDLREQSPFDDSFSLAGETGSPEPQSVGWEQDMGAMPPVSQAAHRVHARRVAAF
jgi:hypothetical protein